MNTAIAEPEEPQAADKDLQAVHRLKTACSNIKAELGKVIVGQEEVVDQVLIAVITRSHALLTHERWDRVRDEVGSSRRELERRLGAVVRHFAYPHGLFNADISRIVQESGFESSQSTRPGLWRKGDSAFAIPRVAVGRYDSLALFRMRVSGVPGW